MTAFSKATLKATWVAGFKPLASDFANLIDSWTDYYAGLEALGAAVAAGSSGVPSFVNASAVSFVAASASAIDGIPIYHPTTFPTYTLPQNSQVFYATTSVASQGIHMEAVGRANQASTASNALWMTMHLVSAVATSAQSNFLYSEVFRGTPSVPLPVLNNTILFQIVASGSAPGNSTFDTASMIVKTIADATAAGVPTEILFSVAAAGGTWTQNAGPQMRVREGHVIFAPKASAPSDPQAGSVYYDSGTNKLRCWNGTSWNDLF